MPNLYYNDELGKWVLSGRDDLPRLEVPDSNRGILRGMNLQVGTTPLINVATNAVGIATMTGITCEPGDIVFGVPKAALAAVVGLTTIRVATTNVPVVTFANPGIGLAGSQAAVGWDVVVIKK